MTSSVRRLREIIPPGAWHALQPDALVRAAADAESGGAQELPAYARSRLRVLTADNVDRAVSMCSFVRIVGLMVH